MFGCYHCLPVQVIGSMGLVGAVAYLFMFRERIKTLLSSPDKEYSAIVLFSYLGLLYMSMVNPGIFCPVVYGLQLAVYFISAERADESPAEAQNAEPQKVEKPVPQAETKAPSSAAEIAPENQTEKRSER